MRMHDGVRKARKEDRQIIRELRDQLNRWDPITAGHPEDEYDCMHGPILASLRRGLPAAAIATVLRKQLVEHFGFSADYDHGERSFAQELINWYEPYHRPG